MNDELNSLGQKFSLALKNVRQQLDEQKEIQASTEKVHVVGAGSSVTAAYEQLRNAAENSEEHLLLQKAIRRFYKRSFLTQSAEFVAQSGDELVTELTFAGYLLDDSVAESTIIKINNLAVDYHRLYGQIQSSKEVSSTRGDTWALDVLAAELVRLFSDTLTRDAFAQFAFEYHKQNTDFTHLFGGNSPEDVDPALFVAVHRALLKSDPATVRAALLRRYNCQVSDFAGYCHINAEINKLFDSETSEKLFRYVDRQGAPLRIVSRMLDEKTNLSRILKNKKQFLSSFEDQVESEYSSINKRINRGIIKSVIFLIITKFLVGIAIEVPYDYVAHGQIIWLPLVINLLFPPIYMVLLRATLIPPSTANTVKLVNQAERMFYGTDTRQLHRPTKTSFGSIYNFLYILFFFVVFAGVSWLLMEFLDFEVPHLIVFFIFLSGASFLGFRLSRMIRELESVDSQQNGVTVVRDFLYMPFVVVGRWMSEKYAQVNIVAMLLDMVIELPLKTVLRLVRQWSSFISSKKDQL